MFNIEKLENIIDHINRIIIKAHRLGTLEETLKSWGLNELINESYYDTDPKGKIVVIGYSRIKKKELLGIAKTMGIEKDRFEFCLDYKSAKTYNYEKLRYNPYKYNVVIFGAVPHSSTGKNNSGSVISEMQNNSGYPRVEVLSSAGEIKITKSNFKNLLEILIKDGVVAVA